MQQAYGYRFTSCYFRNVSSIENTIIYEKVNDKCGKKPVLSQRHNPVFWTFLLYNPLEKKGRVLQSLISDISSTAS